jgi:AP-2 complex subunit alpha
MVTASPELSPSLQVQVKSVDSTVEAGAQFQQMVNLECVADFTQQPDLNVSFTCNGKPHKVGLKIPVAINKFMEPTEMNGDAFFARWKNLSM